MSTATTTYGGILMVLLVLFVTAVADLPKQQCPEWGEVGVSRAGRTP